MKRIWHLLLVLALFVFAACGANDADYTQGDYYHENYIYEKPYEAETTPPPLSPVFPSGRTRAEYLEDLDFLEYIIYNNFPFTGVIYRRLGFDVFESIERMRYIAETRRLISSDAAFLHLLNGNVFAPARHFGHFGLRACSKSPFRHLFGLFFTMHRPEKSHVPPGTHDFP